MNDVRIDKFLWAVRLFKTRSIATEACKKGKVILNGEKTKASKTISIDDIIAIQKSPIEYTYQIKELLRNRVKASLVNLYLNDITPKSELDKLEEIKMSKVEYYRPKGTGRPTKKDRRLLNDLWK